MIRTLYTRLKYGCRTAPYPVPNPPLPQGFRGLPALTPSPTCPVDCRVCANACPFHVITPPDTEQASPCFDLGRCTFCGNCVEACPNRTLTLSKNHRLSALQRDHLHHDPRLPELAEQIAEKNWKLFRRSLQLRQVSAGGCNACEADANVLNTPVFDLARYGIQFTASPRHADGLLITGPVTENMREALLKTYEATPAPKLVIACGTCAISGGPYLDFSGVHNGADTFLPVDLYVPGCPPHPYTLLHGLLQLLSRL